jgi:hypothetical protein
MAKKKSKYVPYIPLKEKGRPREVHRGRVKKFRLKCRDDVYPGDMYVNLKWVKLFLTKKEFRFLERYKYHQWVYKYARCKCPTCGVTHDDRSKFTTWARFHSLYDFLKDIDEGTLNRNLRPPGMRIRYMIPGELPNV